MKNINPLTKRWLTIEDASKYLGVSQDTLRRWEKKGRLIPRRTMGGHRRYLRRQLEELLKLPVTPIIIDKNITYDKQKYQTTSINIPIPKSTPITTHQYTTISSNKYQRILNNIKGFLPTLLITVTIVLLLIGGYLLLIASKTSRTSMEPQFISPLPQTNSFQSH